MNNYVYIQYFLAQLLILCLGYNLVNRMITGYLVEIYSLMLGKRIRKEEYDKYDLEFRPTILPWSIPRYHDYIWNLDEVIKKNSM